MAEAPAEAGLGVSETGFVRNLAAGTLQCAAFIVRQAGKSQYVDFI